MFHSIMFRFMLCLLGFSFSLIILFKTLDLIQATFNQMLI